MFKLNRGWTAGLSLAGIGSYCVFSENRPFTIQAEEKRYGNKMKVIKSTPDGNCLFRSVSMGLYNTEDQHINLRSQAVHWMRNNLDTEIEKGLLLKHTLALDEITGEMTENERRTQVENYLKRMGHIGIWGDYNCIVALSRCLKPETNFKIAILSNNSYGKKRGQRKIDSIVDVKSPSLTPEQRTVWLAFNPLNQHYDLIVFVDERAR